MDNAKGILLILVLLLAATTFLLFVQRGSMKGQLEDAHALAVISKDFLKVQEVRCNADPQQFMKIALCIEPLLAMDDFKEKKFVQHDDGRQGYVLIENKNRKVYDSSKFKFYFNRILTKEGCTVPGDIGFELTCRFDLPSTCEGGDVIEVYYPTTEEDIRVFLKTC